MFQNDRPEAAAAQTKKSEAALRIGQQRYPIFRKYVPLEGKIPQGALRKVCEETGLGSRQASRLAKKFRDNPVFPVSDHETD